MASNFAASFSVRITRFTPAPKVHAKSAFLGYADLVVENHGDLSVDELITGAFVKVDENTFVLSNVGVRLTIEGNPHLVMPDGSRRDLPLFRPVSADARAFLTEEVIADQEIGAALADLAQQREQKLAGAPRQERRAPAPQQGSEVRDLAQQVSQLTSLVERLASMVIAGQETSEPACSEDEITY